MVEASRPWNSLDALDPIRPAYTCDPPAVMAVCAACTREHCPGDCRERREAARMVSPHKGIGIRKNIRIEDVVAAYERRGSRSLASLAGELGVAKSTVRYWLKKAGKIK